MRPVADLLREALRHGDEQRRVQIRGKHLPEGLFADLAAQTHRYALKQAEDAGDGWLIFKEGIYGWWTGKEGLPDSDFSRLYKLRTDVIKRLTDQGLAKRRHPQSVPFSVRRKAE
jgi:hypothetical protein